LICRYCLSPLPASLLQKLQFDDTDDDAINMLLMLHKNIILKDGKGITRDVTCLRPQFSDEILHNKVRNKNGHEFLVDGTLLSPMDALT
jgi:hypothetical protein